MTICCWAVDSEADNNHSCWLRRACSYRKRLRQITDGRERHSTVFTLSLYRISRRTSGQLWCVARLQQQRRIFSVFRGLVRPAPKNVYQLSCWLILGDQVLSDKSSIHVRRRVKLQSSPSRRSMSTINQLSGLPMPVFQQNYQNLRPTVRYIGCYTPVVRIRAFHSQAQQMHSHADSCRVTTISGHRPTSIAYLLADEHFINA